MSNTFYGYPARDVLQPSSGWAGLYLFSCRRGLRLRTKRGNAVLIEASTSDPVAPEEVMTVRGPNRRMQAISDLKMAVEELTPDRPDATST